MKKFKLYENINLWFKNKKMRLCAGVGAIIVFMSGCTTSIDTQEKKEIISEGTSQEELEETIGKCEENKNLDEIVESEETEVCIVPEVIEIKEHYDEIDDNGAYFQKVVGEEVTLDDIILTSEERNIYEDSGLSKLRNDMLNQIQNEFLHSEELITIDRLNVRKFAQDILLSSIATDKVIEHQYSTLYREESDDLDWDNLLDVLKKNNEEIIKEQTEREEKGYELFIEIEKLTDEDLEIWISQFHTFMNKVREKIPNVDMKRLACTLENYSVCYEKANIFNIGCTATVTSDKMLYPLWNEWYPNMEIFEETNYHEFCHLLSISCADEKNEFFSFLGSGIKTSFLIINNEDFILKNYLKKGDASIYFPFSYTFLEESNAESFTSLLLEIDKNVYFDKLFMKNNLEFSLLLSPSYRLGNFEKAGILHNPIALIQQFPVLGTNTSDIQEYFFRELEMLESYNIINDLNRSANFNYDIFKNNPDNYEEEVGNRVVILENYADLQMTRNFLWNLGLSKSITKPDMTLDDCYYLMNLYFERLQKQREGIMKRYNIESIDTYDYLESKENLVILFENYLKSFYFDDFYHYGDIEYSLEEGNLSEAFTEEEKRYIYTLYLDIEEYQRYLDSDTTTYMTEEEIKVYYKIADGM